MKITFWFQINFNCLIRPGLNLKFFSPVIHVFISFFSDGSEHVVKIEFMRLPTRNKHPDHWFCWQIRIVRSAPPKTLLLKPSPTCFCFVNSPIILLKEATREHSTRVNMVLDNALVGGSCQSNIRMNGRSQGSRAEHLPSLSYDVSRSSAYLRGKKSITEILSPGQLPPLLEGPDQSAFMQHVFWHPMNFFSHLSSSSSSVGSNWDQPSIPTSDACSTPGAMRNCECAVCITRMHA